MVLGHRAFAFLKLRFSFLFQFPEVVINTLGKLAVEQTVTFID